MLSDERVRELRDRCTRFLGGHGRVTAAELVATVPPATEQDRYGAGGVVTELEAEVARLLGKPAAVFLPSGTMAQQIALRIHADHRGRRTVVYHPMCHLHRHELEALTRVQGLVGRPVGSDHRLLTAATLDDVAESPAALLVELPQRDLGGAQPEWHDVVAQVAWAHARGAAAHLDGARIWESAAGYAVSPAEVAAPFDSVYVSFYKGIGALPGCCVAGGDAFVAEVREWRKRMGGTLFAMWPNAASALSLLPQRLPRMSAYLDHARAIAAALQDRPGVTVVPDPPQTPMLHALLAAPTETVEKNVERLAVEQSLWTFPSPASTGDPGVQRVELSVGEATCRLSADEVADALCELLRP